MGDKKLDARTDDIKAPKEASYSVVAYAAPALPEQYRNMIFSKWLRSYRYGNDYFKLMPSDDYYAVYQRIVERFLARPNAVVRLAVLGDDSDVVLGWSVSEGDILHYVFVNQENRNQGIATSLVKVKPSIITHLTKAGMNIWHAKLPNAHFNPFK